MKVTKARRILMKKNEWCVGKDLGTLQVCDVVVESKSEEKERKGVQDKGIVRSFCADINYVSLDRMRLDDQKNGGASRLNKTCLCDGTRRQK
tara:strand:- start:134 stop:409 length:276 start_codon:yes stop_codon:yes gene_type:complete